MKQIFTIPLVLMITILLSTSSIAAEENGNAGASLTDGSVTLKTMSVETDTVFDLAGLYSADVNFGVGDRITLGPALSYEPLNGSLVVPNWVTGYLLALKAQFYLSGDRFTDSWIVAPRLGYTYSVDPGFDKFYSLYGELNAGYQWVYKCGITLSATAGVLYEADPSLTEANSEGSYTINSNTTWLPIFHLQIGYAF